MWGEVKDQILHFVLGIVLNIPFIGSFIGVNMREYYQRKRAMEKHLTYEPDFSQVMEGYNWVKKDLIFSYIGVIVGGILLLWVIFK